MVGRCQKSATTFHLGLRLGFSDSVIVSPHPPGQDMQAHFSTEPLSTKTSCFGSSRSLSGNAGCRFTNRSKCSHPTHRNALAISSFISDHHIKERYNVASAKSLRCGTTRTVRLRRDVGEALVPCMKPSHAGRQHAR